MHPLVQAVVVSVLLAASAAGQQPFYSNNGNHQQYPSPSYQANSAGPYAPSSSNYQQQPYNLGYQQQQQTYTQQTYQQPQAYTQQSQQGYSQQQSAASSFSQQSYAAPYNAPSPTSQSYAAYPQPQYRSIGGAQSSSKNPIQSPAKVSSIDSKLSPAPSQQTPLTQYGSALPQTYSTTHQLEQQQQKQQQQQQPSYAAGPAQSSFSNRQLPLNYENNGGFASNNMAPPTTMATYNGYVGPASTVGLNPHQLANRRGPFDKMINRAKEWMPGRGKKNGGPRRNPGSSYTGSDGMSEMHRLPKPPKYPLYDMPSQGMVTPPPPPLMSPMAQMPSMSQLYSTFSLPPNDRPHQNPKPKRGGGGRRRPAAKLPSITAKPHVENKRRRARPPLPLPLKQNKRHRNRGKTPNPNGGSLGGRNPSGPASYQEGFDHPMASNMNPVSSPALGRPLGYEEYMKRPTHSFTDDPWNFDPNAQHYNEGMNTHAMKYNYDPLGTNTLDTSVQSHLDISKMSYPGDVHNMDTMKEPPKPLHSQLGGWDVHPSNYRENSNNYNNYNSQQNNNNPPSHLLPPSHSQSHSQPQSHSQSKHNRFDQRQSASSLLFDDIVPSTTTLRNSFNQYDQTTEASIVRSETLNPLTLLSDGGIEFDIDATLKSQAPTTTYDYKLSDHYSPSADTSHHSSSNSNSNGNSNSNRDNYDPYSSSSYSRYSQDNAYGSRRTRANYRQQQAQGHHGKYVNLISSSTPSTSSVTEGIGVFHDFIKDPNPGVGKARARHSLFNALMS